MLHCRMLTGEKPNHYICDALSKPVCRELVLHEPDACRLSQRFNLNFVLLIVVIDVVLS